MAMGGLTTGLALAALSAFFNGTFAIFGKLCKREPEPIVLNTALMLGVLLSSLLSVALQPLEGQGMAICWSWWAVLAGALLVFAVLFSLLAIPLAGLAAAAATWGCSAMIVAFLWGAVGPSPPRQPALSAGLSALAVALLLLGVLLINGAPALAAALRRQPPAEATPAVRARVVGLLCAVLAGVFGGSILVPAAYVHRRAGGLRLLPSFGIGAAVLGLLVCLVWRAVRGPALRAEFRPEVLRNGLAAGVVWNLGNICQVMAQTDCALSYGIGYPMLQCALLFSGLWGIYFFKEQSDRLAIAIFWVGAGVLLCGVMLLGLYGPGAKGVD